MDLSYSQLGMIREIVREETRYLRHYIGEVVDVADVLRHGRVKVVVPELGWDTPDLGAWCNPRQLHQRTVPAVGSWVEIYFTQGDVNRPVYMGMVAEVRDVRTTPASFVSAETHVLFEDPDDSSRIVRDAAGNLLLETDQGTVQINGSSKSLVTHADLNTALQTFITALNLHTHPTAATGPPSPPTAPMSIDITTSEAQKVKTS